MDVDTIRCVQSMLSRDSKQMKITLLQNVLKTSTDSKTIKVFFSKRRDLNDLLEFIRIEKFKEQCFYNKHLPLVIKNHLRHCILNPYLNGNDYINIEVQTLYEEWFSKVSSNLSYLLQRIDDKTFELKSGWSIFGRKIATILEDNYKQNMPSDSIWKTARVIGSKYAGMGHFVMIGFLPESAQFFRVHEGGSNCYDREYNYMYVQSMTAISPSEKVEESILLDRYEMF